MTRKSVLALLLAAAPALAWAQQAAPAARNKPAGPKPVIDIQEKIKDFGVVSKGQKIKASFLVKNTGTAPLEIPQVRPTCGCTVASFDKTVPPGGTGKIDAEVDTTGFNGPITKALLVFSNDPDNPQVNLVIKADVRAAIEVLPRSLLRFNVLQGEPATEKVVLVGSNGLQFKVTGVDTAGGPYKVTYRQLEGKELVPEQKGSQWEVTVNVPADAKEGMLNQKITVATDAAKAPTVDLNVSGVVRPIVQVIPGQINFGTVPGDAPVGRNVILINNRQGSQLELTDVKIDNPNFTTEVLPLQAGQRYQVAVSMQPGLAKGVQKGTLKITTNDPSRKAIEVPVEAVVQ
ncbi:MAG: DUF1573 domain-containing protein [Acidobacteriota bacterium]